MGHIGLEGGHAVNVGFHLCPNGETESLEFVSVIFVQPISIAKQTHIDHRTNVSLLVMPVLSIFFLLLIAGYEMGGQSVINSLFL